MRGQWAASRLGCCYDLLMVVEKCMMLEGFCAMFVGELRLLLGWVLQLGRTGYGDICTRRVRVALRHYQSARCLRCHFYRATPRQLEAEMFSLTQLECLPRKACYHSYDDL
jgi:hypothetical protein